jgi:hypothetical protein
LRIHGVHRPFQEWWDKSSLCSNEEENKQPAYQSHLVVRDDCTLETERTDLARAAGSDKVSASVQGNGPFVREVRALGLAAMKPFSAGNVD